MKAKLKKFTTITLFALVLVFLLIFSFFIYADQTETWPFTTAGNYTVSDSTRVEVADGVAKLKLVDQTDNTETEFDNGTASKTQWSTDHLELTSTGKTDGSGDFTSRKIDIGGSVSWTDLDWTPKRPYWKELPDNKGVESGYTEGNVDMSNNVGLWHMNESSGAIADSSGEANNGTYNGSLYSQTGRLNTSIGFDGDDDYIKVPYDSSLDLTSEATMEAWVKLNLPTATAISAAGKYDARHTCAVFSDGTARCWGYNNRGQLGNGTTVMAVTPTLVSGITTATAIGTGGTHSCAVVTNGENEEIWCWGYNNRGQLGSGTGSSSIPVQVKGIGGVGYIDNAVAVSAGRQHTCTLLSDGKVNCWGYNHKGQLGDGTNTQRTTPVEVSGISTATAVSVGEDHSCAVLTGGAIKCWGYNAHGELGNDSTSDSSTPVQVKGIGGVGYIDNATAVAAGSRWHTCALLLDNTINCWGYNVGGRLGDGTATQRLTPVEVSGISTATAVGIGEDNSCAVLSDGVVKCWGVNGYGQLGDGTTTGSSIPVSVSEISTATAVTGGFYYTCALLNTGAVKCWGYNGNGQLGDGTTTYTSSIPVEVTGITNATTVSVAGGWNSDHSCAVLSDGKVKCWGVNSGKVPVEVSNVTSSTAVSAGRYHTCVLLSDGKVNCWGKNTYGQLGDGTNDNSTTPVEVIGISTATVIGVGEDWSCAVLTGGAIKCWGYNAHGELGNDSTDNSSTPVQVKGIGGVGYIDNATAVAAGSRWHTCALLLDNTINCWGYNANGRLGDGTTTQRLTPVEVIGISTAMAVGIGDDHSCAVLSDGTAKCWGNNNSGQLGDGTTTQRLTPVSVSGISTATNISGGTYHTCAVLLDGTIKCWGSNSSGQLGNDLFTNSSIPVEVTSINTATTVSAAASYSGNHTCAVLSDGTIKCWGYNHKGQLGVGNELDSDKYYTPVPILTTVLGKIKETYGLFLDWGSNVIGYINGQSVSGYANLSQNSWHHIVLTYNGSQQKIYIDGTVQEINSLSGSIKTIFLASLKIGRTFKGEIDEVAVYSTALSADEVLDHYKRGALRVKYQVRTDDDDSGWPDFYGPAGPGDTSNYYSELSNSTTSPPSISLTNVANNRYFQYKAFLETDSSSYTPEVSSIAFGPAHYPAEGPTVINNTRPPYGNVSHFDEDLGLGNEGSVEYQISNNGTNWYYYNTAWTEQIGQGYPNETNPSSELTDAVIAQFDNDIHLDLAGDFYWKAFLISNGSEKVELDNLQISYVYDSQKPTNPSPPPASGYSDSSKGTSLTSGNWYNHTAPYFTFLAGADTPKEGTEEIASGIEGYWVYFNTDSHAIPKNSGAWQAGNADPDRVYQSDLSSAPSGEYCLRIQSKDVAQNEAEYIASTSSLFTYKYDVIVPSAPDFVTVIPQGYASTNEFTFVWPAAEDTHSGIAGYCYKTGDSNFPDSPACGDDGKFITGTSISTDDENSDVEAYQDGENIFYVRSKDIAGNYGDWIQTTYYFSTSAPSPPQNLTVAPETTSDSPSTTNSFAFSWEKPATYTGDIKGYYYSVNAKPTQDNTTSTTSLSLASGPFAASQGKNTFYIAAKDTAGNINWDAYSSVDFYCKTSAPPIPTGVTIADSSNREEKKYALTITWTKPSGLDENTFSHYVIERAQDSLKDEDFSDIAHTEALGYLDTGLDTTKTYYYRIKACDNAGSCSSPSSVVYLKPTGRYTTPPEIIVLPKVEPRISSATVTWKTDREASSFVQFGTTKDLGEEQGISEFKEEHQVTIVALSANTEYYYRVKSEGVDGNIAYSQISTFKTADAPSAPTDLKVEPETSKKKPASENSFTFSWSKPPDPGITIKGYWYSVNDLPSKLNATYTTKTEVGPYSFATRQEENVFYVVAQDDKGNVNFDNFIKVSFYCETKAPGTPRNIDITDASNRDAKIYRLTVAWQEPKEKGTGIDKYVIERAESKAEAEKTVAEKTSSTAADLTFAQIATVPGTSTGYLDTNLDTNKLYIYRVKASDNAGASSSPSSEVSLRPEGRYTTPPTISNVKLEPQSFGAKVSWKTDRPTDSHVQYGKKSTEEDEEGIAELVEEHEVLLRGLDPETTYLYRVKSKDRDENINYSDTSSFKTLEAPKVSEVKVSDITLTGATISWKTNLITTSKIEYGTTTDYGSLVYDISESKVTSHTLKLESLSSGTDYHYRIGGIDLYENTVLSDDYTFATPPYPRIISQTTENKQEGQTEVRWTTNVAITSEVEYWSEEADIAPKTQGATPKVTEHSILLFSLEDDTTYQFRLRGRDQFGNEAVSDTFSFHTLKDTTPPVITEVYSESNVLGYGEKQKVQIIVAWKTNEPASSKVFYGEGVAGDFSGETEEFGDLVLEHLVVVSDLKPSKIYHFKVESLDKARNSSASETFTVLTSRKRESFLQIIVGVLEDTFAWVKNIRF